MMTRKCGKGGKSFMVLQKRRSIDAGDGSTRRRSHLGSHKNLGLTSECLSHTNAAVQKLGDKAAAAKDRPSSLGRGTGSGSKEVPERVTCRTSNVERARFASGALEAVGAAHKSSHDDATGEERASCQPSFSS
jgi:hypothetical protein